MGSFSHEVGDVNFLSHQKQNRYSARGAKITRIEQMHIRCSLKAVDIEELTQSILEVQTAYATDGQDCGLYTDAGVPTVHILDNINTVNGVQVRQFSYLEDNGAENNIWRTLDIVIQAEYKDPSDQVTSFREQLVFVGTGGPPIELVQTFSGPRIEVTALASAVKLIQFGYAEGLEAYPLLALPAPKFPDFEQQQFRGFQLVGPERGTFSRIHYGMHWRYNHILPGPATAFPMIR